MIVVLLGDRPCGEQLSIPRLVRGGLYGLSPGRVHGPRLIGDFVEEIGGIDPHERLTGFDENPCVDQTLNHFSGTRKPRSLCTRAETTPVNARLERSLD